MPTIVQTFQGRVTGLWGSAHMRGKDGKMHLLKLGDMVHQGDVILTTQNGIVQLSPEDSATAQAVMARAAPQTTPGPQADIDRVISALNESDSQAATAAGLNGSDGAGDLAPGLRVDRISEAVTSTGLTRSGISDGALLPPLTSGGLTTAVEAPRLTITASSNIIDATEEGPAVQLGLSAPTGTSTGAVITLTQVPAIGQLQKADGTPVSAGSVLTPAELVGLKYLPPADYNGSDRVGDVEYTVSDGGRSASGSVGIVLTPVDDAPVAAPDTGSTPEDTPVAGNVLSNDTDVDGPALQVTQYSIAGVTHAAGTPTSIVGIGTLVVNADGGYSFTPAADYHGPVPAIGYTISDGTLTSSSTLTLAVTAVNDAPEAADDLASTPINVPVTIAVLANDHDRDGDALTVTGATLANPAQGTLSVNPDGSLAFTPASNVAGPVTINYTIYDGQGGSDTASVTVNVGNNTAPTGADSTHTLAEDGAYTVAVGDFGFADADAGQVLANVRIDSLPASGSLLLNGVAVTAGTIVSAADVAAGHLVFVPVADGNGSPYASFSFSVQDSAGAFDAAPNTLTLNVTPVNDAPVAGDDLSSTLINTPITIAVLANDSDVDGDPLTVSNPVLIDPTRGSVVVNPDGTLSFTPASNVSGPVTISYTVSDGHGGSDTATVTVNVGSNTAPTGADSVHTLIEDGSYTVAVTDFGFADADAGQTISNVRIDSLPATGSLLLNGVAVVAGAVISSADVAAGQLVFVPVADANGSPYASFTFSVQDSAGAYDAAPNTLTLDVTPVNDALVATNDAASGNEDTPQTGNVLGNDSDVDGDALSVTQFSIAGTSYAAGTTATLAGVGTLVINGNGSYSFTPAADYNGPVPVATYTATDGTASTTATLTLAITPVNDAPVASDDLASTPINTGVTITVLANDNDVDGDALTVSNPILTDPTRGSVSVNPDGTLSFTPATNVSGPVTISYTVSDGHGGSDTASVTVNVGSNTPPTGADSAHTLAEDGAYTVAVGDFGFADADAGQVLANIRIDSVPASGSLLLNGVAVTAGTIVSAADVAAGHLVFVPVADGNGSPYASFSFSVQDSAGAFDAAPNTLTLNVTPVNDVPLAAVDTSSAPEDTVQSGNVLSNDADVDADTLSVTQFVVGGVTHAAGTTAVLAGVGSLLINADGSYSFTPVADYNGPVPVATYTVTDGTASVNSTLTLTVTAMADVVNDVVAATEDTPITFNPISGSNEVSGADNFEGTPVLTAVGAPAHGAVSFTADGAITYTPAANYNGPDSFTYTVTSGGVTETATININVAAVNDVPTLTVPAVQTTLEDTARVISGIAVADVDGDPLTATLTVAHGTLLVSAGSGATVAGDGTNTVTLSGSAAQINAALAALTYAPAADYNGSDSLAISTSDGAATTNASVAIAVTAVGDIVNDTVAATEDASIAFNPISGLNETSGTDNFEDIGRSLTSVGTPAHGTTTFAADGTITYTPLANYHGVDSFSYTVTAGGVTETATITVNVGAINDAPVALPENNSAAEDTQQTGNVLGNDTDVDGDTLSVTQFVVGGTTFVAGATATLAGVGTLVIASDGAYSFTPVADYNGPVPVATYTVTDGSVTTTADLALAVTPVADIVADVVAAVEDTPISFNPISGLGEIGGADTFENAGRTLTGVGAPSHGSVTFAADGTITYTPVADYNGPDSFTYTVTSGGVTETATISVNVAPINDAPLAVNDSGSGSEDTQQTGNVLGNDTDVDGNTLSVTQFVVGGTTFVAGSTATLAGVGTLVIASDGSYTFTPAADYNGPVPLTTYTVTDGTTVATADLNLAVTAAADAVDDVVAATEDTPITFNPITGLNESSGADNFESAGRTLTAVGTPAHGSVSFAADGTITYTPAANYNGPDSFTYTVSSGGVTETATINLNVAAVNDVPVLSLDADHSHNTVSVQAISGLFNTGEDASGNAIALGTADAHYALISKPAGSAASNTAVDLGFAWVPNDANSTWIGSIAQEITGVYQYQTSFTLQPGADPSSVHIDFDLFSDNNLRDILINGVSTGISSNIQYANATHIDLFGSNAAFQSGVNTITFVVDNRDPGSPGSSGPTGLRIDNMGGTVAVIEPSGGVHVNDYATIYVEGSPVAIADADTTITDADNTTLQSATITLTNAQANDLLQAGALPAGITASVDASGTVVTLSGSATLAAYQTAIQAVQFTNTSNSPSDAADRIVTVVVNDGSSNSNVQTTTIHVVPVNAAPVLDLDGDNSSAAGTGYAGSVVENAGAVRIVDADIAIADSDSTTLHSASIVITNLQAGDTLTIGALPAGISAAVYDPASGVLTLSGTASLADYQTALAGITFSNPGDNLGAATRVIEISVNDGSANSNIAVSRITIVPVNDAPAGTDGTASATEDSGYVLHRADFGFSDAVDAPNANNFAAVTVNPTSAGTLTLNGVVLTAATTVSAADLDAGTLVFSAAANASGNGYATLQFNVRDDGGTANGGSDTDASANTLTINVAAVNDAPVAVADTATAVEAGGVANGAAGVNPVGNVLGNDTDADTGDTKTVSAVSGAAAGTVGGSTAGAYGALVLNADGSYTYNVDNNSAAVQALRGVADTLTDTFTYTVRDAAGTSSSTTLTVTILGANDAAAITPAVANLTETNAVLSTGGTLAISDVDSPATFVAQSNVPGSNGYGSFTLGANGAWTYTTSTAHDEFAAGTTYTDSLTVTSADGTTSTITVNILGTNDAAVITPAVVNLTETNAVLSTGGTLAISDVDGSPTFVAQSNVAGSSGYGAFTVNTNGTWTYTANTAHNEFAAGTTYTDKLTVTSADGTTSTITVNILGTNDAAVITPAVVNLTETNALLSAGGTLAISDVDSPATFVAQSNVAGSNGYGHFTLGTNGVWTYATDTAHNEFAAGTTYTDSLTVASADGTTRTITVNILGTNDAPVASNDTGSVLAGSTLTQTAANGVILSGSVPAGRDSDIDAGDTLSVINAVIGVGTPATAVTAAGTAFAGTYGDLVLKSDGSYTYSATRADAIATGSTVNEVFTYQVSDGHGGTSTATLTIGVGGQADTVTAAAPTTTALTSTLGLNGEYYGYNDYNPSGADANRRHSDDGTVGNLDHVADFTTLVNARNAAMGGSASILGTSAAAAANTADASFLARSIDYGGSPTVTSSLGTNVNVAADGSIAGLTDANSQLYRFLDRTAGSDASTLVVHQGTADNDALGAGPTSGLGKTSDVGIRLDGEVYMAAGVYDIRVTGDDGYRLKLGGNTVAMVDDIQSPTSHVYTGIGVTGGMTALELLYWEQGGNAQLKVEYKLNGAADATYQVLGTNTLPMFSDANAPTLADNQHLIAGSTAGSWLVESGSILNGAAGNDTLTGGTGSDKLVGGVGNDVLSGAAGDDVLVGGKGNDTLAGGAGHDVFRWELADGGTAGTPARDTINGFDNASYSGDVLDLRDLLVGENHAFNTITGASTTAGNSGTNALTTVADAGNLGNYLHFSTSGGNTVLEISSTGGFSSGYSSGAVDQVITITGVNLVAGLGNDGAIIADLFKRGKLVTDGH